MKCKLSCTCCVIKLSCTCCVSLANLLPTLTFGAQLSVCLFCVCSSSFLNVTSVLFAFNALTLWVRYLTYRKILPQRSVTISSEGPPASSGKPGKGRKMTVTVCVLAGFLCIHCHTLFPMLFCVSVCLIVFLFRFTKNEYVALL